MAKFDDLIKSMRDNPKGVRFFDWCKAKAYQVKQVLQAIERLEVKYG